MSSEDDLRDFGGTCRLFPLPGVVLFPHVVLPLHIFEPRYRQMTRDALAGDRLVAIVQARPLAGSAPPGEPELEEVACLGKILNWERLPDGRYNFLLLGLKRIRLVREIEGPTLYRQARAELLDDIDPEAPAPTLRAELIEQFRAFCRREEMLDPDLDSLLRAEPPLGLVTDVMAHALALPAAVKQAFLSDRRADRRAEGLIAILRQLNGVTPAPAPDPAGPPFPPPFSVN